MMIVALITDGGNIMARSGAEVVRKHKSAIGACDGKDGWAKLECIVDSMQKEYGKL